MDFDVNIHTSHYNNKYKWQKYCIKIEYPTVKSTRAPFGWHLLLYNTKFNNGNN